MKKTLFVLCLLSSTAAFAQYYSSGGSRSSDPVVIQSPSHPSHASYAPMSPETSILAATSYTSAQGERRASDFPQAESVPLGTVAREMKKQRAQLKRSRVIWIN